MNDHLYILIMAGGEGVRFQPLSTPEKPKQFLTFWGVRTFVQQTYDRIAKLVDPSHVYVATNARYVPIVREQLSMIPEENIIGEPMKKNTAPCIAYACELIRERDKDAVVAVLPSDHVITKEDEFVNAIKRAIYIATEREVLVTLGIHPDWAADCYGYIKINKLIEDDPEGKWHAYTVDKFIEKPTVEKAEYYIADGSYFWNSGMFVWQASIIIGEIQRFLPKIKQALDKYAPSRNIHEFFGDADSISIDYGVMERSNRVVTIPCNIGWSDIGTWESLYNLHKSGKIKLEPEIEKIMLENVS